MCCDVLDFVYYSVGGVVWIVGVVDVVMGEDGG